VVADRVVVGWVLVVVVVGSVLVVVGPVVVGSALVVVSRVVVDSTLEVETAVVVGAVMVGSGAVLGVVTGGCVVSLGSGASDVVRRPAVVIGRLAAEGVVSGLLVGGEGAVAGSWVVVVVVVKDVEVRAGSVVTVGSATPGCPAWRFGLGQQGGRGHQGGQDRGGESEGNQQQRPGPPCSGQVPRAWGRHDSRPGSTVSSGSGVPLEEALLPGT
jgi:hypothetical protein